MPRQILLYTHYLRTITHNHTCYYSMPWRVLF